MSIDISQCIDQFSWKSVWRVSFTGTTRAAKTAALCWSGNLTTMAYNGHNFDMKGVVNFLKQRSIIDS